MKIDYAEHYNKAYFTGGKKYRDASGKEQYYHGPALTWDGFQPVADTLAKILPKGTLIDVGCSGGDLTRRLVNHGFDARGVDISEYAIANCHPSMKERLSVADISTAPDVGGPFDILISTDLLEHIYYEDLDKTFQWMLTNTKRFMFFLVAVTDGEEFVHTKGEEIPPRWEMTAISGHVHVRRWRWWAKYFLSKGLKIRWDLMYLFQLYREKENDWKGTAGWDMPSTFVLSK